MGTLASLTWQLSPQIQAERRALSTLTVDT